MLQTATNIDLDELHALLLANQMRFTKAGLHEILSDPNMHCVGLKSAFRLLGAAVFQIESNRAVLFSVDVHPEFRKQGLGRKLINMVAASAQQKGRYRLLAVLSDPDSTAADFLKRVGFKGGIGMASECCGLRFIYHRSVADDVLDSIMAGQGRVVR